MGNSPTDKSKDFIESGKRLISQPDSDELLKKIREKKEKKKES